VVFLYGGSWRNGERGWYRFAGATLAEAGLTVIIPDYRKAPEVLFPAFVEDAAAAFAYAHRHIDRFGGDRQQLFLMGHSAGAHIAALLCTDRRYLAAQGLKLSDVRGMVGLAGPYDFLPMTGRKVIEVFNGDPQNPDSQPVNFVDGDEPPMLLLHGLDDRLVWPRNSESLDRRMQAAGRSSQLKLYADLGHVGILLSLGRSFQHWSPALSDTLVWIRERAQQPGTDNAVMP
jgi:acetyl esterase/lipase